MAPGAPAAVSRSSARWISRPGLDGECWTAADGEAGAKAAIPVASSSTDSGMWRVIAAASEAESPAPGGLEQALERRLGPPWQVERVEAAGAGRERVGRVEQEDQLSAAVPAVERVRGVARHAARVAPERAAGSGHLEQAQPVGEVRGGGARG